MTLIGMGIALWAFSIFALALENNALAAICFVVGAWCVS